MFKTNLRFSIYIRGIESLAAPDISGILDRSLRVRRDRTPSRGQTQSAGSVCNCRTTLLYPKIEMEVEACRGYSLDSFIFYLRTFLL
jgi:hypothetical protein